MQTKLLPAASSDRQRLENLLEKYNYEFSQYDKTHFDADGLFGYEWLPTYFESRDDRAAYLIYAEESLAGFALINRIAECDRPLDWAVAEFFVAYPFRRNGVGSAAMEQVFVRHSGRWQIKYHSKNLPSAAFWNGIARHYAVGSVETLCGAEDYADGTPATVLCFSVPAKAQSSRIRLLDTSACWGAAYADGAFSLPRWRGYLDSCLPGAAALCLADAQQSQAAGIRWERDILPVLNAVPDHPDAAQAVRSFRRVTERLDERIRLAFGKSPDAEVVLMLGLGNGAGWATTLNGKPTVLLGIEKIVELHWCSEDDMNGLVLHELGHVYAAQFGTSLSPSREQRLLAQLFSEGIAMVFEQELVGNPDYFHQNVNGWTTWCHEHLSAIAHCFAAEAARLTRETQRYFGDWVSFEGYPDVGYYLGARFVRFLMEKMTFDEVLRLPLSQIQQSFDAFCASL